MPQIQEQIVAEVAVDVPASGSSPAFVDRVLAIPVVTQEEGRTVQNCADHCRFPQVQFLGKVVVLPVVVQRQVPVSSCPWRQFRGDLREFSAFSRHLSDSSLEVSPGHQGSFFSPR